MILTPIIEMLEDLEDLEEDQAEPTKEAMISETLARKAATQIIQRMRAPTKIREFLLWINSPISNAPGYS